MKENTKDNILKLFSTTSYKGCIQNIIKGTDVYISEDIHDIEIEYTLSLLESAGIEESDVGKCILEKSKKLEIFCRAYMDAQSSLDIGQEYNPNEEGDNGESPNEVYGGHSQTFLMQYAILFILLSTRPDDVLSYLKKIREPKAKEQSILLKKLFAETMDDEGLLAQLRRTYEEAQGKCSIFRSNTEKLRVSEVWSRGQVLEIEPLEIFRGGDLLGKYLAKVPLRTYDVYHYWLDSESTMVARFFGSDIQGQFYEEFFAHEGYQIKSVLYSSSPAKLVVNIKNRLIINNLIDTVHTFGKFGARIETFKYSNRKLTEVLVREMPENGSVQSHTYIITYIEDSTNPLKIIQIFPNGRTNIIYEHE